MRQLCSCGGERVCSLPTKIVKYEKKRKESKPNYCFSGEHLNPPSLSLLTALANFSVMSALIVELPNTRAAAPPLFFSLTTNFSFNLTASASFRIFFFDTRF